MTSRLGQKREGRPNGNPFFLSVKPLFLWWQSLFDALQPLAHLLKHFFQAFQSLSMTIAAGSSQIQRNIISERILGLPKERR